ncbi:PqiC family protein [Sinimarinibacterium thermocellulolyticum]|uniref:PqiC family protein n=1 Tax=Sinimarinibacterium thermocellulolyticum TaxID=3170016 RepID=A0ABV2A8C4_9GAMM
MIAPTRDTLVARRAAAALLAALMLAACASPAPTRFYTLLAPAGPTAAAPNPAYAIEVLPAEVPGQVDVPQLVVRSGAGELTLVETRLWAAPLRDELRTALSELLRARLGVRDVYRLARADELPVWRIKLVVGRFDTELGVAARIQAGWSIRGDKATLSCASLASEAIGAGFEAAVQGHQRALAHIADEIAAAVRALQTGPLPSCSP